MIYITFYPERNQPHFTQRKTETTNLPFTISIPFDLDKIAYDGRAVLDAIGFGDVVPEGLHVPGGGGAAFGAEAAVEADVFVFDHDAAGFEAVGDVEVLREIERRDLCALSEVALFAVRSERDAARRADIDTGVALDAFRRVKDGLDIAV